MGRAGVIATLTAVAAAVGGAPALGGSTSSIGTSGNTFSPAAVSVAAGETVSVTNSNGGAAAHNLVWEDGAPGQAALSTAQWSVSRTFPAPGDFRFYCSAHGAPGGVGMAGIVSVRQPPAAPPAPSPPAPGVTPPAPGTPPAPPPAGPGEAQADTTAPRVTRSSARATRRRIIVRLTLSEAARVTVEIRRRGRTLTRKVYRRLPAGRSTLRVRRVSRRAGVSVRLTAVDAAGNRTRRSLRVTPA